MMHARLKIVDVNECGVDYICSDIHGHFSLLGKQLDRLGFDPDKDRLFSLGDLIDRGPESGDVLKWLEKPWFYAVQGNHERMLINTVEKRSSQLFSQWSCWGGEWAATLSISELENISEQLQRLPVAIELQLTGNKKAALVHAELPDVCDWNQIKSLLLSSCSHDIEDSSIISDMLWKSSQPTRSKEGARLIEPVQNIDHVFHGHTIVDFITTLTNRTFLDLGSYLTGDIRIVEPNLTIELKD